MSLLTNLKLNYITNKIRQIEDTTANQDILDEVIKFINDNSGIFTPEIDMTKVNKFIEEYMSKNASTFQGIKGDPPTDASVTIALANYFNTKTQTDFIDATFSNIKKIDNSLVCGNTTLTKYLPPTSNVNPNFDIATKNISGNLLKFDFLRSNLTSQLLVESKINAKGQEIECGMLTTYSGETNTIGTIEGVNKMWFSIKRVCNSFLDVEPHKICVMDNPPIAIITMPFHNKPDGAWFAIANGTTSQIRIEYKTIIYTNQTIFLAPAAVITFVYSNNAYMPISVT